MQIEELRKIVTDKLKLKPHIKYIDQTYINDTVDDAINDALDFINYRGEDLDNKIVTPVKDLCVYRLIITGNEGVTSSSKAGTSGTYTGDIPKSIRRILKKYRNLP